MLPCAPVAPHTVAGDPADIAARPMGAREAQHVPVRRVNRIGRQGEVIRIVLLDLQAVDASAPGRMLRVDRCRLHAPHIKHPHPNCQPQGALYLALCPYPKKGNHMPKCEHTYTDGRHCKANAVSGTSLCNAHNGVLASYASQGAQARAAKRKAARDAVQREEILATMGLDARLRVEASRREGELIAALLDLALVDRDRQALLAVFDRLEGRATQRVQSETVAGPASIADMSTEELFRMLENRVVPGTLEAQASVVEGGE